MKTAQCCCGSTTIELEDKIKLNALCHCDNCRKRTGSAFGHSLYFPRNAVRRIKGETRTYNLSGDSGSQERYFCPACGTTLDWHWARFPDWVGVAGGCFTERPPHPTISACHENVLNWVHIPESWRRY